MKRDYPLAILMVIVRTELERDDAAKAALNARRERDELAQERHEAMSELARIRLALSKAKVAISRIGERERFDQLLEAGMRGDK